MTPTMSFGEVGTTTQTMSTGRVDKMHGVGLFEAVKVLERQRLITDTTWTTASPVGVPLFSLDAYKELMSVPDNEDIISMFNFFRASVELTVRLNTNQFYYGALMATLYPAGAAGTRIDSRSVQSPSIISAASEQAIIKKWDYAFPYEWVVPINVGSNQHGLVLTLDVLAPLKFCSTCSPVGITIQVWARFTDIELSYPTSVPQTSETILEFELPTAPFLDLVEPRVEKQSKVVVPAPSGSSHPAQSRDEDDTVTKAVTALESVTLGDIASRIPLFSALSYLVDKPDCVDSQYRIVQDYNVDTFATDVPDISTPLVYRKGRYQDPVSRRIPLSSNLTLSQYAQIPGLLSPSLASPTWQFTAVGDTTNLVRLIQVHPFTDTMRKPLDYAALNAVMWRGSINVMIQFFTTSFISARFVVQYHNPSIFATSPEDSTYDSTLSRVINVKGDTVDCFNLPWLHPYSWGNFGMTPSISLTLDSNLAAPCSTADQVTVYAVIWVAGGPDIQFANPRRIQYDTEWSSIPAAAEKQAMVHEAFQKTFPPIVENCKYDIDNGYCTSEQIGSMADYAKRYGLLPYNNVIGHDPPAGWSQEVFALLYYEQPPTLTDAYVRYWQFRQTPFGQMRSAFLFMSGGFRFRRYTSEFEYWVLTTNRSSGTAPLQQSPGVYVTTQDSMIRASVPYSCYTPYQQLGYYSGGYAFSPDTLDVTQTIVNNETTPNWLAARDDVMFGWPILPVGLASPELPGSDVKGKEKVSLRKATDGSRRSRFVVDRSD